MRIAVGAGFAIHLDLSVALFGLAIYMAITMHQPSISVLQILVHKSVEIVRPVRTEDFGNEIRLAPALEAQIFENAVDVLLQSTQSAGVFPWNR